MKLFTGLFLQAVAVVGSHSSPRCRPDACLQALSHVKSISADCSSYLRTTVTPSASTRTVTVNRTVVPTRTVAATATTTVPVTEATLVKVTKTSVIPSTTTVTKAPAKAKRGYNPPTESHTLPAYAAPWGPARYSSACSCFGVYPTTVTAPATTVTRTATATATPTVVTVRTTVTTVPVTRVATTVAVTTAVATRTVTAVHTAAASPPQQFALLATSGSHTGRYGILSGNYVSITAYKSNAGRFTLDAATHYLLAPDGRLAYYNPGDYRKATNLVFLTSEQAPNFEAIYEPLQCKVHAGTNELDCSESPNVSSGFVVASDDLGVFVNGGTTDASHSATKIQVVYDT